jgi:hypothetical protein
MSNKNRITYFFPFTIFLLLSFSITGCKEGKVTITKDYVINPNWEVINNSFDVKRMKLKVSSDNINI